MTHLFPGCRGFRPVPRQQATYLPELFSTVTNIPNLIVKMSVKKEMSFSYKRDSSESCIVNICIGPRVKCIIYMYTCSVYNDWNHYRNT